MYMHHYQKFDQIGIFTKIYGNTRVAQIGKTTNNIVGFAMKQK